MTKFVGILNITPDSFSDGGKFVDEEKILQHLQKMLEEGADVIDVGAESTRPQAVSLTPEEEWLRLANILIKIVASCKYFSEKHNKKILTSIDSYHFETIKKSYELNVDIVNDVKGLQDERIVEFIAKNNITTILMHNEKLSTNPQIIINDAINVVDEIIEWARRKIKVLQENGVKKSQLIFDPGIGFNKNAQQSIRILRNVERFKELDLPIYIGHSKKSFMKEIFKDSSFWHDLQVSGSLSEIDLRENDTKNLLEIRAQKTVMISRFLMQKGVDYIRVHDVAMNRF